MAPPDDVDLSQLSIHDSPPECSNTDPERALRKYREYIKSIPYGVEPESKMIEMLDFIVLRIEQCTMARDYEVRVAFFLGVVALMHWLQGGVCSVGFHVVLLVLVEVPYPEGGHCGVEIYEHC